MTGVAEDSPGNAQSDPDALALAVADAVNDGSDKENRKCLEDMFDDDSDDDDEFSSSAPPANGDDNSQQERLVASRLRCRSALTTFQQTSAAFCKVFRSRRNESLLPAIVSIPISIPMAEPLRFSDQRLRPPRVRIYLAERCIPTIPIVSQRGSVSTSYLHFT